MWAGIFRQLRGKPLPVRSELSCASAEKHDTSNWSGPLGRDSVAGEQGTDRSGRGCLYENAADTERLMEEACEQAKCQQALKRVKANRGAPVMDGTTVTRVAEISEQQCWLGIQPAVLQVLQKR